MKDKEKIFVKKFKNKEGEPIEIKILHGIIFIKHSDISDDFTPINDFLLFNVITFEEGLLIIENIQFLQVSIYKHKNKKHISKKTKKSKK